MKLLLTSAGITNDAIAEALSSLAGSPLSELAIIHIPTAANTEAGDKGWVIDDLIKLKSCNFKSIDILDVAAVSPEIWKARIKEADIVSFGGGNEQYLAKVFEKIGMKDFLISALSTKIYMGTSAGSMVAGQYLSRDLLKVVYPEEDFGDSLENPMQFYNFSFIPHLNSKWFTKVRKEILESIKDKLDYSVYATDDETAIKIDGDKIEIVGEGESWIFNKK